MLFLLCHIVYPCQCIPIISTVHSNTSFKMTTYTLSSSARVYIAVCETKEKEQVMIIIIKQPNQNTFCEHSHQRLINPIDPIVPWITQKIQTILVFPIMIYKCEFYSRNPQLHLYVLISLLNVIPSSPHCLPSSIAFQPTQLYTLIHHSK